MVRLALVLLLSLPATALGKYRPQFVNRTLNKTVIVDGNRAQSVHGGYGTYYLYKEKERDYYRGPCTRLIPYREDGDYRSGARDCDPERR